MTSVGKTDAPKLGINFPLNPLKTKKAGETTTVKEIKTVNMHTNKTIDRADLDNLSPYAGLGVKISKQPPLGSVESYAAAAPEFNTWKGNFKIENKQEAVDYLSAYNTALKTYSKVAPHIQDANAPYADLYA